MKALSAQKAKRLEYRPHDGVAPLPSSMYCVLHDAMRGVGRVAGHGVGQPLVRLWRVPVKPCTVTTEKKKIQM